MYFMDMIISTQQTLLRLERQHVDKLGTMATPQRALSVLSGGWRLLAVFLCFATIINNLLITSILQMLVRLVRLLQVS